MARKGIRTRGLSPAARHELWRRWRDGQTLTEIGEALEKTRASIFAAVRRLGGHSPVERTRSDRSLSSLEREEISRGLAAGESIRSIASRLDRPPSTVSPEVCRNGGRSRYRAAEAYEAAYARARRPKRCLLAVRPELRSAVASKLSEDWSPEQISGWLRREFPIDAAMQMSHETIYKSLFGIGDGLSNASLPPAYSPSPNPSRTSAAKEATASSSSAPSAAISISVPQVPASINICMIDFPSTASSESVLRTVTSARKPLARSTNAIAGLAWRPSRFAIVTRSRRTRVLSVPGPRRRPPQAG
jgi:hypothetical protein